MNKDAWFSWSVVVSVPLALLIIVVVIAKSNPGNYEMSCGRVTSLQVVSGFNSTRIVGYLDNGRVASDLSSQEEQIGASYCREYWTPAATKNEEVKHG